jgi:hypothetical protein
MSLLNLPVPVSPGPLSFGPAQAVIPSATPAASNPIQASGARRVRFWVKVVTVAGSTLTTIAVKLQERYNDGVVQGGFGDLPSSLDDAQGTAQPKAPTFEIAHTYTVTAGGVFWFKFHLDNPAALHDIGAVVSANATGQTGESVTVYAQAG